MHVPQRFEHAVIEIPTVDERQYHGRKQFIRNFFTRPGSDDARLDIGIALPTAAVLQQVALEGRETDNRRAAVAERSQSGVDTKHKAVGRHLIKQCDDLARQSREIFLRAQGAFAIALAAPRVKKNKIDIRREIELPSAQFAHAEHDQGYRLTARVKHTAEAFPNMSLRTGAGRTQQFVGEHG